VQGGKQRRVHTGAWILSEFEISRLVHHIAAEPAKSCDCKSASWPNVREQITHVAVEQPARSGRDTGAQLCQQPPLNSEIHNQELLEALAQRMSPTPRHQQPPLGS
jgi:hypothetical protein